MQTRIELVGVIENHIIKLKLLFKDDNARYLKVLSEDLQREFKAALQTFQIVGISLDYRSIPAAELYFELYTHDIYLSKFFNNNLSLPPSKRIQKEVIDDLLYIFRNLKTISPSTYLDIIKNFICDFGNKHFEFLHSNFPDFFKELIARFPEITSDNRIPEDLALFVESLSL